ncbi:S8 family serine peptidase [Paludisphaera soli]|uniref:S8 family serine peptidase n=1 Tax=Paludisphaera soli TaxID=2712865 RepID=UPI0013EDAC65|nr:S8 family serine peptidase [Paludisphaera soli]
MTNPRSGRARLGRQRGVSYDVLEARTVLSTTPTSALLVQLKDASLAEVSAAAGRLGATLIPTLEPGVLQMTGTSITLNRLAGRLESTPGLGYVEPRVSFSVAVELPNDPYYANGFLWGLNGAAGAAAPTAWDYGQGSSKVAVGIVDTGIDYDHPDLYLNVWINQGEIPASRRANLTDVDGDGLITFYDLNHTAPDGSKPNQGPGKVADSNGDGRITGSDLLVSLYRTSSGGDSGQGGWADGVSSDGDAYVDDIIGWNFVNNTNRPYDDHGHGTHVAGIVGAVGDNGVGVTGVNWRVQLMALKFLDGSGNGFDSAAAAAVRYAAAKGARVTNNSYGGVGAVSSTLASAIAAAAAADSVFVAAAGNSSLDTDVTAFSPASSSSPNVVSVAAIGSNGALASFSNYGRTTVDLAAPGVGILSTLPGNRYASMSGTSMAAPFVAGSAALLLAGHPEWTYTQIVDQLLSTARPLTALQGKVATGGTLDVGAAVKQAAPPPAVEVDLGFQGTDATTRGTWKGTYGAAAYAVAATTSALPPAGLATSGASLYTWAASTADPRALQTPAGTSRIASTWYSNSSFTVALDLSSGPRDVSLYFLDWDTSSRSQRIDVLDAAGNVIDSRSIASFRDGVYLTWRLEGRVSFRFTRLAGHNAVLNGLFVDAVEDSEPPPPADDLGFQGTDATTRGTWKGTYGAAAYAVAATTSALPPAGLATSGASLYTWAASTADPRALQTPAGTSRIASTWYSNSSFTVALDLSSGPRDVSLYFLDWDTSSRSQRIDVLDAAGNVIDSRSIASFRDGVYLTWRLEGRVSFRFTRLAGHNAVLNGLFVD